MLLNTSLYDSWKAAGWLHHSPANQFRLCENELKAYSFQCSPLCFGLGGLTWRIVLQILVDATHSFSLCGPVRSTQGKKILFYAAERKTDEYYIMACQMKNDMPPNRPFRKKIKGLTVFDHSHLCTQLYFDTLGFDWSLGWPGVGQPVCFSVYFSYSRGHCNTGH